MRRTVSALVSATALMVGIMLAATLPSEPASTAPVSPAPSATPSLPPCPVGDETGAGMALCWWDAQAMGNGMGTSVESGDCALSVVGTPDVQAMCIKVHAMHSVSSEQSDGTVTTMPNGAALVQECTDIDQAMTDKERINEGWSLMECFKAYM